MSQYGLRVYAYDIAVKNADGMTIYYFVGDSTAAVTNSRTNYSTSFWGDDYSGDVVIPESVEYGGKTYKVTYISNEAFFRCSGMTSISIPSSVTGISGDEAFYGCYRLTSVIISDLSSWCNVNFGNAYANPLIYAGHLYLNNKKITKLIIPDDVTNISSYAFSGCSDLTSVTIPNSVSSIGEGAFKGCNGLTSVAIPNSVTSIGSYAFDGTPWLDNQPDGLVYVGKIAYKYKGEMPAYTRIAIKDGTYGIAGNTFYGCKGLTSINIPNSVTSIGSEAFSGCSGLTSVTIPNSVTSIGSSAFSGCSSLTSVIIPNSVTSIGNGAFFDCSSLTSFTIPNRVTTISNNLFYRCSSLTTVIIPNSVTSIGYSAFEGCSGLESIKVDSGNIKYDSRDDCNAIIETSSNTIIWGCKNTIIPNSVTSIGYGAFYNCSGLTSVTIPNSVTSIGSDAFYGTAWYNNQPDGLVYAGKFAYKYKGEMPANTQIRINDGTLGIAEGAFYGCSGLTSVTIPNSVTTIGNSAFYYCSGLTSVTIPNSVTSIGSNAFCWCSHLTSVTIPNSVTSIGSYAFFWCSDLTSVTIPNSVTSIGSYAFEGCSGLTSITIPNSVTSIGDWTFYCCENLTFVTIPNSVKFIGRYAFSYCRGLTTITSEIEEPFEIDNSTFDSDTYYVAELIVPYGTKAAYQNTVGWNKFTMITEAEDKDVAAFTLDGVTYQGSKSTQNVVVKSVDTDRTWLEVPASVCYDGTDYQVTGIDNDVFKGSSLAALIWDVEATLPNNAFSNASIGSNFLLYVKSATYAPSTVKNVVVDGTAQTIVLSDDGGQFYCPQAFMARSITYSHNYSMETGGEGKGWETIVMPFDVQRIVHSTRGEIVPFAVYNSSSNQKPFWLAYFSSSGFRRASQLQANEPYIIAMPNSSSYRNEYNLAGDVTFSAENVTVQNTPTFDGAFVPAFAPVVKSPSVKALNNASYSGGYDPGSRFIPDLRDVHPFEAYMTGSSSRGIVEINFDAGMTDMLDVLFSINEAQEVTIHTLSGQQVAHSTQRDFDAVRQQLPKGVYIVNGKKWIK